MHAYSLSGANRWMQDMLMQPSSEAKCPVVTVTDPQPGKDNLIEWMPREYSSVFIMFTFIYLLQRYLGRR